MKPSNIKFSVHARDMIPKQIEDNSTYIINLDDHFGGGTHWVAISNFDVCCYFDSFGIAPPPEIIRFMKTSHKLTIYSDNPVQNYDSFLCGYYCLFFCLMSRDYDPYTILYIFDHDNDKSNDRLVIRLLKKYYKNL